MKSGVAGLCSRSADSAAKVPPGSLIGLYGAGMLLAEIERDLGRSLGTARTASRR